ncbi:unnamed protein product [Cylindrotheca closterium]|uniref:MORN repeat-containing protein 5 n=1 Tax=Cylindrotheca closterium TaxID=2856 RepID=A0AAD2JNL9_9STRA|nr:unnamed protein product [Cylindrotheca closterium]
MLSNDNNNMNNNAETVDHTLINPNDVLSHKGKGKHEGNCMLRETIIARSAEFHVSSFERKKEILDEIVLGVDGRFLKWDSENRRYFVLTNEDAVTIVRKQFGNLKFKLQKQAEEDFKHDPNQDLNQEPIIPEAVLSLEAPPTRKEDDELNSRMESMSVDSELRRFLAQVDWNMFDDEETAVTCNKVSRDEDDRSAKGTLLKLLSDEGGEQLAQTLLSIVSSADQEAAGTAVARPSGSTLKLDDEAQESLKAAKKSLLQQQERPRKSARNIAPEKVKVAKPEGQEDQKTKSSHASHSVLSFQIEHDMQHIQIEKNVRMGRKEGAKKDREYTGSMMENKPHGVGSMIYDNGRILIGNWAQGVFQGQGCAIYENDDMCFGSFLKGKADGCVSYITEYSRYIGDYQKNTRHGKGLYNDIQMGIFNGDFVEGRFEGLGVHTAMNGNITKGRFENWKIIKKMATIPEGDVNMNAISKV